MTYVTANPQKKISRQRLSGQPALSDGNHNVKTRQIEVPPPMVTAVRSPTPEEILETLRFMFAVGIECSNPITTDGHRVDELEATGHYEHWKKDLQLVRDLGLRFLRYGPPIHRLFTGPGQYNWQMLDPVMEEMQRLNIKPIIDLVHFGLPDWLVDFQNPDWPRHVADYAGAFCQRYPWVRFYTPVNEIFVTAQFSGAFGWWNERLMSDQAFVTNLKYSVKASMLMMREILRQRADAILSSANQPNMCTPAALRWFPRQRSSTNGGSSHSICCSVTMCRPRCINTFFIAA